MDRRNLLKLVGAAAALVACGDLSWAGSSQESSADAELTRADAVRLPAEEWRRHLTPGEYNILRSAGTERAFSGDLWDHKADGVYVCAGCGLALFDSKTKFKSGTGWPSYYTPIDKDRVLDRVDGKFGMIRTENVCARCGGHLGHVFTDGPKPTGLRYCINSYSMDFVPRDKVSALDGEPVMLGGFDARTESKKESKPKKKKSGGAQ